MTPNIEHQIVSIAEIQRRARRDHAAGRPLSECAIHPHSPAYATYAAEYALLHASPSSHAAPSGRQRVDQAQGASPP